MVKTFSSNMFDRRFNSVFGGLLVVFAIQQTIEAFFSLSEVSELIRAKKILMRRLPMLFRDERQPLDIERQYSEFRPQPLTRSQRQSSTEGSEDKSDVSVRNTLLDTKSLMGLISLKQKIVSNVAVLVRRLIDEIVLTLRLIMRVFTFPLMSDNRTIDSLFGPIRQDF